MAIEIVDLPANSMVIFNSYVKLPEGTKRFVFFLECSPVDPILSLTRSCQGWDRGWKVCWGASLKLSGLVEASEFQHFFGEKSPGFTISHDGSMVLLWCAMDPIKINPSHVSIYIPAPAGSVMGFGRLKSRFLWILRDGPVNLVMAKASDAFAQLQHGALRWRQWSHHGGRGVLGTANKPWGPGVWMIGGHWNSRNFKAWQLCDFRWCILSSWPWFKRTRWAIVVQPQMMIFGDTPVENHRWWLEKCIRNAISKCASTHLRVRKYLGTWVMQPL